MTRLEPPTRPVLGRALSAFGAVVIIWLLVRRIPSDPPWAIGLGITSALLWLLVTLLPDRTPPLARSVLLATVVVVGAASAVPTQVTGFVPALVAVLTVIAAPQRRASLAVALPLTALALAGVGSLGGGADAGVLIACAAALALAVVLGISRGQTRMAEEQSRRLLGQQVLVEQERTRSAALAERSRIARDLHDVLAQSLGGLVLQLEAVDALLEAGRVPEAAARVRSARALGGDGLDEARRAVDALREPGDAEDLPHAIGELVELHRSLEGTAELAVTGAPGPVPAESAGALRRAAQEVLSNARRHAPGVCTGLTLRFDEDAVVLTASTPPSGRPAAAGGAGRGLAGLRERATAAGGEATWRLSSDGFTVEVRVPR